jgi:hypothetical protein
MQNQSGSTSDSATRVATRLGLHGVAELVLAGPQFHTSGTIELRAVPGGFGTVADPDVRVLGHELVAEGRRTLLAGQTLDELATACGLAATSLSDVYAEGPGLRGSDRVEVDPVAATEVARAFGIGDAALRALAADHRPILWPEHFDIAIDVDEVNYGVSPGDSHFDEPYAYVGAWQRDNYRGDFWNAPFGAARTLAELRDADGVLAFFTEGRSLTS